MRANAVAAICLCASPVYPIYREKSRCVRLLICKRKVLVHQNLRNVHTLLLLPTIRVTASSFFRSSKVLGFIATNLA